MRRSPFKGLLWLLLLSLITSLCAQERTIPSSLVPPSLREVTARAGTILVGRVVTLKPMPSSDQAGSVEITFQVEQGIRGAKAGEHFSFREWIGLWSGPERYHLGQRMMLFLYTPSKLGLTSPVGGPAGRLLVDASGRALLTPAQQQSIQVSPTPNVGALRVPVRDLVRAIRSIREE